jgi:hypothetical protein
MHIYMVTSYIGYIDAPVYNKRLDRDLIGVENAICFARMRGVSDVSETLRT